MWGTWASLYNIPKSMFYLLKGDYKRKLQPPMVGGSTVSSHRLILLIDNNIYMVIMIIHNVSRAIIAMSIVITIVSLIR